MRPDFDSTMIEMAGLLASLAACNQRKVGCLLTDRNRRIIGSGYNGRPAGAPNCTPAEGCGRCEGLHAEVNALLHCHDVVDITTAYVTAAPCWHCIKALLATPCVVVKIRRGAHLDADQAAGQHMWERYGRRYAWV